MFFKYKMRDFNILICLFLLLVFYPICSVAEQKIEEVQTEPESVYINVPSIITFSAKIAIDPTLLPTSVNLLRINDDGTTTNLGRLYDDGTHGDTLAGDNIFASQVTFNELTPKLIFLRVSVAYKGVLKRKLYDFSINVKTIEQPEQVRSSAVNYFQAGDTTSALTYFSKNTKVSLIKNMDAPSQNRLADWIANAQLINEYENYRIYKGDWVDDNGVAHSIEFTIYRNQLGQWKIIL